VYLNVYGQYGSDLVQTFVWLIYFIDGLAKKFGLTPEQFGENLRDNYQRHEVEQEPTEPMEVAKEYISKCVILRSIIEAIRF
jgi:transcription elongation factor SPT6